MFFFDEGRFGLRSSVGRMWYAKGKELVVLVKQGFENLYAYSAVSPQTGESFSLFMPEVNTEMMSIFLQYFSNEYKTQHLVMVMDQAGWHKSRELIIPTNIEIIFLPPYSPELNPVERLWKYLKQETIHNFLYDTLDDLNNALEEVYQNMNTMDYKTLCNCNYL
ncbi:MAG: IS630 family transposase [bacterium]